MYIYILARRQSMWNDQACASQLLLHRRSTSSRTSKKEIRVTIYLFKTPLWSLSKHNYIAIWMEEVNISIFIEISFFSMLFKLLLVVEFLFWENACFVLETDVTMVKKKQCKLSCTESSKQSSHTKGSFDVYLWDAF